MRITPRVAAAAFGGVILSVLMAGSASAVSWGSVTSYYDNRARSTAYGDFYASSSYVTNKVLSKDLAADGNTIYTEGIWYWTGPNYSSQGSYNTPEHNRTYYVTNYKSNVLVGPADKVRATTKACVQLGWPVPDKCSVAAYATVTY